MRRIPLSPEQRDAGDSLCRGMRGWRGSHRPGGSGGAGKGDGCRCRARRDAGCRGKRCRCPGPERLELLFPTSALSWKRLLSTRARPGRSDGGCRGLSAVKFSVSSPPSPFPPARARTARCQKSCRWYFSPAEPSHLFWGIINPFGVPAFSCQRSPNAVSEGLSLPMCCQLGDGQQTLSLLSDIQHSLSILKDEGHPHSTFLGVLFGIDPCISQRLGLKAQSCCSKAGPQPCGVFLAALRMFLILL